MLIILGFLNHILIDCALDECVASKSNAKTTFTISHKHTHTQNPEREIRMEGFEMNW